jgi:hypothetical protein
VLQPRAVVTLAELQVLFPYRALRADSTIVQLSLPRFHFAEGSRRRCIVD